MFSQLKNIDSAFKHIKLFSLVFLICCVAISCFALYKSHQIVAQSQERIYILANGKALEAYAEERKDNIPVEARDHVKMFHHYFFTLHPDDKAIQQNIVKALYMADGTAKRQYDNLKENGYFTNIITGNISQELQVDSIQINTNTFPFYFRCFAKQKIIRASTVVTRNLITEGYLRNVARTDHNPHGFLIERWITLENKDINIENR
jgi:conjugative transposon TraK protein